MDFRHASRRQRVVFSRGGAAEAIAGEVARLDARRILLIASDRADPHGALTAGLPVVLRSERTLEHVPLELAETMRSESAVAGCDAIVAIGGGSAVGLGKAVALTSALPLIAVPTTYAGSEATDVWGLTSGGRKLTGRDDRVLPVAVIYDAALSDDMPIGLTVTSGLNALAHGIDALWAPGAQPISTLNATEGIRLIGRSLRSLAVDARNANARETMLLGVYLASSAFADTGPGLHHKICHVLGGTFGTPHSPTHAILLPHVVALFAPAAPEADASIAAALGAESAIAGVTALTAELHAPTALREIGFPEAAIAHAARLVAEVAPPGPVAVGTAEIAALLRRAWAGALDPGTLPIPERQAAIERDVIARVIASFEETPDPRLRDVITSLVTHLHAFARETRLTEAEWEVAIRFLTDVGQISDDRRQEFILLSDVLGLSMQTVAMANPVAGASTEATVFGPFFVEEAPLIQIGGDIAGDAPGEPCWIEGSVRRLNGSPVSAARIEVWEADEHGRYDVQYGDDRIAGRAHLFTDDAGSYAFWGLTPTPYPIPDDGPVGALLRATGRSPYRAPHLHFMVSAPGARTLITHIFVRGGAHLDDDSVFGVKDSLIIDFDEQPAGTPTPDGRILDRSWSRARFDIVVADT